jgi:hypothetical protein
MFALAFAKRRMRDVACFCAAVGCSALPYSFREASYIFHPTSAEASYILHPSPFILLKPIAKGHNQAVISGVGKGKLYSAKTDGEACL